MDRNTVALEMAKVLLPQWDEYAMVELLMEDAFRAADAFIEQARQENKESPENSEQHRQLAIAALWQTLGRQPVGIELTEAIMASFEAELQQQAGA